MYEPSERAGIFGWYLLGPLLGPGSTYYLAVDFTTLRERSSWFPTMLSRHFVKYCTNTVDSWSPARWHHSWKPKVAVAILDSTYHLLRTHLRSFLLPTRDLCPCFARRTKEEARKGARWKIYLRRWRWPPAEDEAVAIDHASTPNSLYSAYRFHNG